jgi:carboxymethylenebutenolidase
MPQPQTRLVAKQHPMKNRHALHRKLAEGYPEQEAELKKNKIRYEGQIYPDSVHGFFNDATPERYNKETAQQAWARTIEWFNEYVRGAQG